MDDGHTLSGSPALVPSPRPHSSLALVTLGDAAAAVGKTPQNIRDYLQRGRILKYDDAGNRVRRAARGRLRVDLNELREFLRRTEHGLAKHHGAGLHAELGFYHVAERDRTKHVHRLHPYLGKFIPQLVEWFLARHFRPGDTVLDPFMGSGTTLVQANEMGMRAIGVDISEFNCRIARVKTERYDLACARREVLDAEQRTRRFSHRLVSHQSGTRRDGDVALDEECARRLRECTSEYLKTWFAPRALLEILHYRDLIERGDYRYPDLLRVLLSRAARSSRLVPHDDLATPRSPLRVGESYRCRKHGRQCLPIDNCITKIHAYSGDTLRRLTTFAGLRSAEAITVVRADSRTMDLSAVLRGRKLDGIFTSPPYVGQIDYHDQHNYAYELFGIERNDGLEIGPRFRGKSARAQREYVEGIVAALRNVTRFLAPDARVFIVANDRLSLYPEIARLAGFTIVERFHRAVTKRTEKGDDPYRETVFHLRQDVAVEAGA